MNVGSGGRPKDGDWRVCYALVDPAALAAGEPAVEFVRVPYDYERLARALAAHRPDHRLRGAARDRRRPLGPPLSDDVATQQAASIAQA